MSETMVTSLALVWCEKCLEYHRMFSGIGAPMYWCEKDLMCVKRGQEVTVMSKGKFKGYGR